MFDKFVIEYAKETGCDKKTAMQATFVFASLLSHFLGKDEISDYFSSRATEMESEKDEEVWIDSIDDIDEPMQVTSLIASNDEMLKQAYLRNSYWI